MPTYEYECCMCGSIEEDFRTVDERDQAPRCLSCGGPTHRVPSVPGLHFKGPGFHCNDYPKESR